MQKFKDYQLICVYNNIKTKKVTNNRQRIVSKIMFDSDIFYTLESIDKFTQNVDKMKLPLGSKLYIYDAKEGKVLLPINGLMSSDIKVLESVMKCDEKSVSPRTDTMWRDSFTSVLINDLTQSKGTFIDCLKNEKFTASPLNTKNKISYFYGDLTVDPLLSFPYMPKQGNKLNHSHYEFNTSTNKFYITDVNPNIVNYDEHVKNMNDKIEALATWYGDYRNVRNYYLFRRSYYNWKEKGYGLFEKEEISDDVKLIKAKIGKSKSIAYNQLSFSDIEKEDKLSKDVKTKKEDYLEDMNDNKILADEQAIKKAIIRDTESKEQFDHLDEYVEEERNNSENIIENDDEMIPVISEEEQAIKKAVARDAESDEKFDHLDEYVEEEKEKIKAKGR